MSKIITEDRAIDKKDTSLPPHIGEVVNDYFLHGETSLAIAYRQRRGQEVCETLINSKIDKDGRIY